jgi:hypothetical protein
VSYQVILVNIVPSFSHGQLGLNTLIRTVAGRIEGQSEERETPNHLGYGYDTERVFTFKASRIVIVIATEKGGTCH